MMAEHREDFDRLWRHWYPRLYAYSGEFAGLGPEDREEATGDVLLRAWERRGLYRPEWAWSTWLYRLARNGFIDAQRRVRRQLARRGSAGRRDEALEALADGRDWGNPEATLLRGEGAQVLRRALEGLGQVDRELLHLVFGENMTYGEAAAVLGMPEGTAKSRVSRAKRRLALELEVKP